MRATLPTPRRLPPSAKAALKRVAGVLDVPSWALYNATHRDGLAYPPFAIRAQVSPGFRPSQFFDGGRAVADAIEKVFSDQGYPLAEAESVLDLACGCGRVVMHLPARYPRARFSACDVDFASTAWADKHVSGVEFKASSFDPPLPYPSDSFDRLFAFSLWTHLSEADQLRWLAEVTRVLRPDGVALLTTHGVGMHKWMSSGEAFIESEAFMARLKAAGSLRERDFLFMPYDRPGGSMFDFRGIDGDYGLSFQTPEHTQATWSSVAEVIAVRPSAVAHHDAVLVRPRAG